MIIEANEGLDFLVYEEREGRTVEIVDIQINTHKRAGVGSTLVETLVEKILEAELTPSTLYTLFRRGNEVAQSFYHSVGLDCLVTIPNFYMDNGEDAVMFGRVIK